MKLLLLSILMMHPVKPQPKIVDVCRVVNEKNKVACHKIIVGTFPDNPNWKKVLK